MRQPPAHRWVRPQAVARRLDTTRSKGREEVATADPPTQQATHADYFRRRPAVPTEPTWRLSDEAETDRIAASDRFREVDTWKDPVASWADERTAPFSVADVLTGVLGKPLSQQDRRDSMRVAGILTRLGFEKRRVRAPGYRSTLWWRRVPGEEEEVG